MKQPYACFLGLGIANWLRPRQSNRVDPTALERVLLAVKVLHSCLDPRGSVTEEEIKQLRLPSDEDLGLTNYEIACLAITREVKLQEDAKQKAL